MTWTYLIVASLCEGVWAVALKYSEGFTKLVPSLVCLVFMVLSVLFLGLAVRKLPIGTAYAIWTGIGATLTAIAGIFLFHEPRDWARLFFMFMILAGVVGLKAVSH